MSVGLRGLGLLLAGLGVVAALSPQGLAALTEGAAPTPEVFEAIERRVRGGMVLGVGLILIAVPGLRPLSTSLPSAVFYFMAGALAARLLGLLVDGVVPRQWQLVAVETGVMTLAALCLGRGSGG
ncbi:MAG: hypothetical protein H6740_03410 [Alphaproteobacteria bacterium]|nr:hypothetical protein [Alphaproteobacteria bacterium]